MVTKEQLRFGHICGIISSQGQILSEFTGEKVAFHEDLFPFEIHGRGKHWRWNYSNSINWLNGEHKLNQQEFFDVQSHLTKKYGMPFWDNGYHDIDWFMDRPKPKRAKKKRTHA